MRVSIGLGSSPMRFCEKCSVQIERYGYKATPTDAEKARACCVLCVRFSDLREFVCTPSDDGSVLPLGEVK